MLPTSGGAEAFSLIARAYGGCRPVVIHPQFTEPEAALRAAGHDPGRLVLQAADGFTLDPARVPAEADLVMIGNPTNPTGVLHRRADLRLLARPGRIVVVDEAFMDAVVGERESLLGADVGAQNAADLRGILVIRSLTKTWGIPGIRAGYVVGDADLVAALARQQPPWSVSTPAIAAMVTCCGERAEMESRRAAVEIAERRTVLVDALTAAGFPTAPSEAPFVLIDVSSAVRVNGQSVRQALHAKGFAVRRGETFPGLSPSWIRVALRDNGISRRFVDALVAVRDRR